MTDHNERAAHVIRNAQALGAETFIRPRDITDGNKKLNISFVAQIFNANHGLTLGAEASPVILEPEPVDAEDTREARTFRMWMNSLNIENVYINDLFDDLHDGEKLLKIIDAVGGGCVDWKK
jgi:plastin-1